MDKPRLSPRARALCHRIDQLFDELLIPAAQRKQVTAALNRLLDEGDDNSYASSGRLMLPLEYESRVYRLLARPDADTDDRSERLELFGLILDEYIALAAFERGPIWTELIRVYPAPLDESASATVPSQGGPTGRPSALPL